MSDPAWRPYDPVATLVGIPGRVGCWEDSGDFLRFLLKRRFICIIGGEDKTEAVDLQHQTHPFAR